MTLPTDIALLSASTLLGVLVWPALSSWLFGRDARRVGPYLLAEKIGQGAMGEVFRARHERSGEWRAIKLLPRGASARDRERFENEARLGAGLRHAHAVSIYDRGEARDGTPYYAMELIDGVSLEALVEREGRLAPERVIRIISQLCAALGAAHRQGLVHRDIKPDNVLVRRGRDGLDDVKLIDFGLVKRVGEASDEEAAHAVVGTPLYLSPEAITAPESVGARSDLYGVGALAYFLLSSAPVFEGRNVVEVCSHHLHSVPLSLRGERGVDIAEELERIVLDCLSKDPAARPESADELAARLAACAAPRGRSESRARPRRQSVGRWSVAAGERCAIAA